MPVASASPARRTSLKLQAVDVATAGQARDVAGRVRVLIRSEQIQPGDKIAVTHLPNAVSGLKVKTVGN